MHQLKFILPLAFIALAADNEPRYTQNLIAQDNNRFAFDLYNEVSKTQTGNIFFSPFSISTALAMTYAGAANGTAVEIKETMHFKENTPAFHTSYGHYLQRLDENAKGNIELRIANRIWVEKTYALNKSFVDLSKKAYNAPLIKANFIEKAEKSRSYINNWIEEKTENRIKDLLPEGSIDGATRLVLANAIYFKGDWLYQFKAKKTKPRKFYQASGQSLKKPFMNFKGAFAYQESETCKMISLPYKGEKHSMVVVLPHKTEDLEQVASEMTTNSFAFLDSYTMPEVILSLPKFKMSQPLALNKPLQSLGIVEGFTKNADFSGMSGANNLMISGVLHKAFIEVDEKGTEAAAATAIVVTTTSTIPKPKPVPLEFIANKPFVFYIIDNQTKAILFMGRIMNPISEDDDKN